MSLPASDVTSKSNHGRGTEKSARGVPMSTAGVVLI